MDGPLKEIGKAPIMGGDRVGHPGEPFAFSLVERLPCPIIPEFQVNFVIRRLVMDADEIIHAVPVKRRGYFIIDVRRCRQRISYAMGEQDLGFLGRLFRYFCIDAFARGHIRFTEFAPPIIGDAGADVFVEVEGTLFFREVDDAIGE